MHILGIDIGGTKTSVCLGNERGEILASGRMSSEKSANFEQYGRDLAQLCASIIERGKVARTALQAVGISAPGPLDIKRGILIAPPNNPGWRDVPIVALVKDILKTPVYINNDANACALAEYLFGAYRGTADLVYLTFSTGMGGGIIANGRLLQGITDTGGEVGHQIIERDGPLCGCGQRGCWEAFVGGRRVAERLREKIRAGSIKTALLDKAGGNLEAINMELLAAAAREGDEFAVAEWNEFSERLAQGIGNLIMILNPQVVLLGTIAIHLGEFILAPLREKLRKYAWSWPLAACRVEASTLGANIGDYSALAVALTGMR
ncbi:MAG: ROK family protein [Lentisphaerae bacterium]|nr:ROK family protein [Lentisphaerota bacterium]